jgi:hypothetical protein
MQQHQQHQHQQHQQDQHQRQQSYDPYGAPPGGSGDLRGWRSNELKGRQGSGGALRPSQLDSDSEDEGGGPPRGPAAAGPSPGAGYGWAAKAGALAGGRPDVLLLGAGRGLRGPAAWALSSDAAEVRAAAGGGGALCSHLHLLVRRITARARALPQASTAAARRARAARAPAWVLQGAAAAAAGASRVAAVPRARR